MKKNNRNDPNGISPQELQRARKIRCQERMTSDLSRLKELYDEDFKNWSVDRDAGDDVGDRQEIDDDYTQKCAAVRKHWKALADGKDPGVVE